MSKMFKPDAEQPYFDAPEHIPPGSDHQIPHSHRCLYQGYDIIVHLVGYEYESLGQTLWAMGVEIVRDRQILSPVQVDQERHYPSVQQAAARGVEWGRQLVDQLG
ncbi:hypothetical protein [Stutzerimonas azotifigens]|uniref:hypothetical protein n=1 Tax=Stutzerimonas azotifigens TaxID=291995 RepID=UPI0003FD88F1|nr:hypothetical protein [Stutzerimonas azotifigens]